LILAIISAIGIVQGKAQQVNPAAMMQRMKEQIKPELMDKVKMTEAQADKVVEVNYESRQQMRGLRDLNENE